MSRIGTVAISGYYGQLNTGDNALAATIAWGVWRHLRPGRLRVLSTVPLVMPLDVPVEFLRPGRVVGLRYHAALLLANLHVIGGGSVIHDDYGTRGLRKRLLLARLMAFCGEHTAAVGVSLGPLRRPQSRPLLRKFLERAVLVCARDARSMDLAMSVAPRAADRVLLSMDPAVLIDRIGLPEPELSPRPPGKVILVSPASTGWSDGRHGPADYEPLARCLAELIAREDCTVRLLAMNGSRQYGDEPVCLALAERLPADRTEVISYDPNPLRAFRFVKQSDVVLGMRLHSVIYAYAAEVPFVALGYHPKVIDFMRLVSCDKLHIHDHRQLDTERLREQVHHLLAARGKVTAAVPVSRARKDALDGFARLQEKLERIADMS